MSGQFVGWIRTHWSHWEPVLWDNDRVDLWERLREFATPDEDGERVVLPHGTRPVARQSAPEEL
ncbi:hypothetical protein AYO44_08630 [Planctomycetaceae bacterium SCGC AG-212-F19]|nr:hypothetical protein AYO44_08630 [Planctomycetaceae bacterium SCGC AG-212-F19]